MSKQDEGLKEEIAEFLWTRGKPYTRFHPLSAATSPYWRGIRQEYFKLADQILAKVRPIIEKQTRLWGIASLTLLTAEIQGCKNMGEVKRLVDSWVKANNLKPEDVKTYESLEQALKGETE